jgi:hypothetical protein
LTKQLAQDAAQQTARVLQSDVKSLSRPLQGRVRDDIVLRVLFIAKLQNSDSPHHPFDKPLTAISDILIRFT